ncbi:LLM class flavin-dependent oxidoreductase [Actinocorallia lasiicapitis]
MRFGLFLPSGQWPGQSPAAALDRTIVCAAAAEEAGFDGVWLAEHHFMTYGVCPSATTLAAHLLGATSRILVGTAVSVLSTRHPVALAEEAALLSAISNGRFCLGVGRGGPWQDLEVFGTGLPRYETHFPESLDVLLTALRSPSVAGSGPAFTFRDVALTPPPHPRLPIHLACTSPATERLAAARNLPMLLGLHIDAPAQAAALARYASARPDEPRHEHGWGGHIGAGVAWIGETGKAARAELVRGLVPWLEQGLAGYVPLTGDRTAKDARGYARWLAERHAVGSTEEVVAKLREEWELTRISRRLLLVEGDGTVERTVENIRRLGAEVLPKLRATGE